MREIKGSEMKGGLWWCMVLVSLEGLFGFVRLELQTGYDWVLGSRVLGFRA